MVVYWKGTSKHQKHQPNCSSKGQTNQSFDAGHGGDVAPGSRTQGGGGGGGGRETTDARRRRPDNTRKCATALPPAARARAGARRARGARGLGAVERMPAFLAALLCRSPPSEAFLPGRLPGRADASPQSPLGVGGSSMLKLLAGVPQRPTFYEEEGARGAAASGRHAGMSLGESFAISSQPCNEGESSL